MPSSAERGAALLVELQAGKSGRRDLSWSDEVDLASLLIVELRDSLDHPAAPVGPEASLALIRQHATADASNRVVEHVQTYVNSIGDGSLSRRWRNAREQTP